MKFFKKKNLLNVLYAVLIALPLFSILGRVLYTQWNQNAKDSYSGNQFTQIQYINLTSNDEIPLNQTLHFTSGLFSYSGTYPIGAYAKRWYIKNVSNIETSYTSYLIEYFNSFGLYIDNSNNLSIQLFNNDVSLGNAINLNSSALNFDFEYVNDNTSFNYLATNCFSRLSYENVHTLDNAFDYSISQFVSDNDFGKLNFFTWFSDLFLSNNSVNNLYIHFVNWYLNYTLYVSLGYILWLVLMWFVSFIRRLLEKTSTYETGGF